ncbi:MAG: molybdopterin molybdotransferase MoeA [Gammaproteobacteria bacterium]|nr:molybdopterin molybdotransferase MoeA [Gammaproteobacteria bacterium]
MISVSEAWQRIATVMVPRPPVEVAVADANGRILAQSVRAERDQPPFDRVMMDGIAITLDPARDQYQLQATQAAGAPRQTLASASHCIEVMTGAVLPHGTDTVVPVEQLHHDGDCISVIGGSELQKGQFIHRQGSDYSAATVLLESGQRIRAPEMAILASSGLATTRVAAPPSIAVVAVGDELVAPGEPITTTQIRRSNDFAIASLLHSHGTPPTSRHCFPDDPRVLEPGIGQLIDEHDIVVLSGGVSMGKFDYIPTIMDTLGVEIVLHKVAQRPGKPMWIGRRADKVIFALPGNPVSALVCARRYLVAAIDHAMGSRTVASPVIVDVQQSAPARLTWFCPVIDADGGGYRSRGTNTSGDFHALKNTVGFVELPPGTVAGSSLLAPLWRW